MQNIKGNPMIEVTEIDSPHWADVYLGIKCEERA
jgi:hypothetical protein